MPVLVLTMIFSVVFAIWWYWWRPRPRSPRTYPGALPIIGHIFEAVKYRNDGTAMPSTSFCFNSSHFKTFLIFFLLISVPTWKIHRKLLNPAFNQKVLNTFVNVMNVEAQSLVSQFKSVAGQGPVDVKQFIIKYVLRSVCRTSLGLEANDQHMIDKEYVQAIEETIAIVIKRGLNVALHPSFIYNITKMRKRQQELITRIKNILNSKMASVMFLMYFSKIYTFQIIKKRKSDLKTTNKKSMRDFNDSSLNGEYRDNGKFKPILDLMLHLSDEQQVISDDDIRQHIDTFVFGSYDTTSAVLQTTLLVLGSHPDVQERVYKEIKEVLGNNEELTKYDLPKLVYLEAVIKEVLRIYSIAPWVARQLDTDVVFRIKFIISAKYTLRAGSTCILVLYSLHRHPSWGPDAKQFKPERWLNPETLPTNPNVYAPFGIGKRNWKQYAMMTLKTSVAHIVRNFQLSADISNLNWKYEVVLKPTNPILVSFTLRS
ncbi:unnamed protein product [Spodoptera littoralis]|uniref:Cytochrome n=1 Tax=Spodoptera littoralis TaxID=7109 RepID=A0A9P0I5Q2_SPOLI|nr:unnamed protein product [Spodoptera littoralis]